jgi:hypothetical protein
MTCATPKASARQAIEDVKCRCIFNFKFYIVILHFDFYIFNFVPKIQKTNSKARTLFFIITCG